MDEFIKLLAALAPFAWPAIAVYVLWLLGSTLKEFIGGVTEGSVKGFGIEASGKRRALAAAALATATLSEHEANNPVKDSPEALVKLARDLGKSYELIDLITRRAYLIEHAGRSVLWVDDEPSNNVFTKNMFEILGVDVTLALSTDEALRALSTTNFDAIISDMSRPEGAKAGYDLLEKVRSRDPTLPFIFFTTSRQPEHVDEAVRRGATGATNSSSELLKLVTSSFKKRK